MSASMNDFFQQRVRATNMRVERPGASRLAQFQFVRQRRLAPAADADSSAY